MFDRPLEFLAKNEDDLSAAERAAMRALMFTLKKAPQPARQAVFQRVPSPYGVTGVFAGETEAVHAHTLKKCYEQYLVPVQGQADILITGVPYISPYNVNSFLNPLLVQVMANGYLFNLYKGLPMVKKGGTMIVLHPCTDLFDNEHHAPYIEFVHRLCPRRATRWSSTRATRRSSRTTRRTSRCTASATRTTRPTRSSCGTGARRVGSTSAA